MNRKSYPFFCIALLVLGFRALSQPSPKASSSVEGHLLAELERQSLALKTYWPLVEKSATDAHVDPRLVASIVAVESWNRPGLRRFAEVRLAELCFITSKITGMPPANISVGISQLKLETAFWIGGRFRRRILLRQYELSDGISAIDSVSQPQENIRLAARYLSYLGTRRYGRSILLMEDANESKLEVVATEYHIGMQALGRQPIDRYGRLVAELAHSDVYRNFPK